MSEKELLRKEIDLNLEEQNLLRKRIEMMKTQLNDLPSHAPQYSMLRAQIEMDQIEIEELKSRHLLLLEKISDK